MWRISAKRRAEVVTPFFCCFSIVLSSLISVWYRFLSKELLYSCNQAQIFPNPWFQGNYSISNCPVTINLGNTALCVKMKAASIYYLIYYSWPFIINLIKPISCISGKLDKLVKSPKVRHSGESRSPEPIGKTGFRLSPEWHQKGIFDFLRDHQT